MAATHFSGPLYVGGIPVLNNIPYYGGKTFFASYMNGSDANGTGSAAHPWKTIARANGSAQAGRGDVICVVPDWSGNSTTAYVQGTTSPAWQIIPATPDAYGLVPVANGGAVWAKDNTHLFGMTPYEQLEGRATLRVLAGTDITTTTLLTCSAMGCSFTNIDFIIDSTVAAQAAVRVTGQRNVFRDCQIGGMIGNVAATSRCLVVDGGGSGQVGANRFLDCHIGLMTAARGAYACAEIEIKGMAARTEFDNCKIWSLQSGSGLGYFVYCGASSIQDFVSFDNCKFWNPYTQSGAVAMAKAMYNHASSGGPIVLGPLSQVYGATALNYAANGNIWGGGVPAASTGQRYVVLTG